MGIVIIVTVGIFSQMILKCPDGFAPEGWTPPAAQTESKKAESEENKNWKEMMKMPVFYLMIVMLFFGAVLGMMAISQASNIAQDITPTLSIRAFATGGTKTEDIP